MRKKWLFLITLLVSMVFVFSSADCEESQVFKPGIFTKEDLSLVNSANHTVVKYGMEREQVEKLLGPSQGKDDLPKADIYENIAIFYRNNQTAAALIVNFSDGKMVPYRTWRGIGRGSSFNDVEAKYGEGLAQDEEKTVIIYLLEETEQGLIMRKSYDEIKDQSKVYILNFIFNFDDQKSVSRIFIMDFHFSIYMS